VRGVLDQKIRPDLAAFLASLIFHLPLTSEQVCLETEQRIFGRVGVGLNLAVSLLSPRLVPGTRLLKPQGQNSARGDKPFERCHSRRPDLVRELRKRLPGILEI